MEAGGTRRRRRDVARAAATLVSLLLLGRAAQGECAHPYFPTRIGTEWVYAEVSAGPYSTLDLQTTERVVGVSGSKVVIEVSNAKSGSFHGQHFEDSDRYQMEALCDAAGLRKPRRPRKNEQVEEEGPWLAPASLLSPGKTWTHRLRTVTTRVHESRRRGTSRTEDRVSFSETFTVQGVERVEVPAGRFDAVKVVVQRESDVKLDMNDMPPDIQAKLGQMGPIVARETVEVLWFAKGVGLVKEASARSPSVVDTAATTKALVRFTPGSPRP